jgi:excisionase family DNA binding protein
MATGSTNTDILMVPDTGERLKITAKTISRLAAANKIPAFKAGRNWRLSTSNTDAWGQAPLAVTRAAGIDN